MADDCEIGGRKAKVMEKLFVYNLFLYLEMRPRIIIEFTMYDERDLAVKNSVAR